MHRKARLFWPIVFGWLALDIATKRLAVAQLGSPGTPHQVLGDFVRLTLTFNQGAALGMSLGKWSRPAFTALALAMLGLLAHFYRTTSPRDRRRAVVLAFITAGAIGNLIDRLRWSRGVVDFIDIGIGSVRWWTFNLADMGITLGAIALAFILGQRDAPPAEAEQSARSRASVVSPRRPGDDHRGRRHT